MGVGGAELCGVEGSRAREPKPAGEPKADVGDRSWSGMELNEPDAALDPGLDITGLKVPMDTNVFPLP